MMILGILALGMLIISPFLSQASTSLLGSNDYGQDINTGYSCDAGVEYGIWQLIYNSLGEQIPNVGDSIDYSLPYQVNGIKPDVTITKTQIGDSIVTGNITKPAIDTFQFDTLACYKPQVLNISGSVYAIAYTSTTNDGYLKTVNIASDGTITKTAIDTWRFESQSAYDCRIIRVSGNVYLIAYRGINNGRLITVTIATNGAITKTTIDTQNFDTTSSYEPYTINVSGNVYAVAYRRSNNTGMIKTYTIATNGAITNTAIDTWTFDATACYEPRVINVSSNVYAIAYRSSSYAGTVKTITIATNGAITKTARDTWNFDTTGYTPMMIRVSGNIYAISYRGAGNGGYIKTLTISTAGAITKTAISTLNFEPSGGYEPYLSNVSGAVYAVAYRDSNNQGAMKTCEILTDGQINQTIIDTMQYVSAGYEPFLLNVGPSVFAVAYRGSGNFGFLKTIRISQVAITSSTFMVQSTAGDSVINASVYVSANATTTKVVSWVVQ